MPYTIRKGVLYHDGRAQIALGQSYYPSYHPQKVPVPPTGDRLGEMAKDLRAMREAGFNVVRMAALGDVTYDQGKVSVDFPLPDAFCRMCEEQDLGAMIRLQGYSMNLRNFPDATMVDQQGQPMENAWSWFIRNCVNHPGIIEDNRMGTRASAAHFAAFPSVCSFQIYNEPAYPNLGLYDYHPETLRAYAAWRAEHGLPPQEAPRSRPAPEEDASGWVAWRTFLRERLNGFLCDMAAQAKAGYDAPATLTCHMSCPLVPGATVRGEDYYTTAQGMDILGITCYLVNRGPAFHQAAMTLDACESAAACFGKKAWLIEYNARTDMPPQEWPRETYAALGRGFKGIFYYQWRADLPYPDGPEPEQFGMLYSDGRKASSYDMGVRMNRLVNRLSEPLAEAEKVRSGVALLYSDAANAFSDARDNRGALDTAQCAEQSILALRRCYTLLNQRGLTVDFLRPQELAENPLDTRVLILPYRRGLPVEELTQIEAFQASGGRVYEYLDEGLGFRPYAREQRRVAHGVVTEQYGVSALCDQENLRPALRLTGCHGDVDARLLRGKDADWAVLTNFDPLERPVEGAVLEAQGIRAARAYGEELPEEGVACPVADGRVLLPRLAFGGIIRLDRA